MIISTSHKRCTCYRPFHTISVNLTASGKYVCKTKPHRRATARVRANGAHVALKILPIHEWLPIVRVRFISDAVRTP